MRSRGGNSAAILLGLGFTFASIDADAARPVVAVFDLEHQGGRFKSADLERLTDYLATSVTATGRYQIVPRSELKSALAAKKSESYKVCYDKSCQIEIGKELAAEKTLAGRISRFGKTCMVTLKLFDLAKATAEAAGAARGPCKEEAVLTSLETAVAQLAGAPVAGGNRDEPTPVAVVTPKVEGGDYGDLDREMREAAENAAREVAERRARESAAKNDWAKLKPFVEADHVDRDRKIQVLEKFLGQFESNNPHRAEAEALLGRLRNVKGMVRVPGGSFYMGCNSSVDTECDSDEKPGRTVSLKGFFIDKTEVTVGQYRRCVNAGGCSTSGVTMPYEKGKQHPRRAWACNWKGGGKDRFPMNCVTWSQADAFCKWAGKRLPTGKEWEKAARGTDARKYPWGNRTPKRPMKVGNVSDEAAKRTKPNWRIFSGYDDGMYGPTYVGRYPQGRSPYGVDDMFGNVWEWTADAEKNGKRRLRGCSYSSRPKLCRLSNIKWLPPATRRGSYGFRCAL